MKKELIERIILLNDKTNAFKERPHIIQSAEISESLKMQQRKFWYGYAPLFMIMIILTVYMFIANSLDLPTLSNRIFKIIPFLTILKGFNLGMQYSKIELIKEQLFLNGLLEKIED